MMVIIRVTINHSSRKYKKYRATEVGIRRNRYILVRDRENNQKGYMRTDNEIGRGE